MSTQPPETPRAPVRSSDPPPRPQPRPEEAAERRLADRNVVCADLEVDLGDTDFRPGGAVEVTLSCVVDLSDLTGLGVPTSATFDSTFSEPVDVYRGADP